MFSAMRRRLALRHEEAQLAFASVPLSVSFRSAPDILKGVDAVFAAEAAWRGLTGDDAPPPPHEALRHDLPASIEVWPPIGATKAPEREDWRMPVDETRRRRAGRDRRAPHRRDDQRLAGARRRRKRLRRFRRAGRAASCPAT